MGKAYYKQEAGQFHLYQSGLIQVPIEESEAGTLTHIGPVPMKDIHKEDRLVHSSDQVAVAYVKLPRGLHIFTHGTATGMADWVKAHNSSCKPEHKASLKIFDQSVPVMKINQAIEDPEFLQTLL